MINLFQWCAHWTLVAVLDAENAGCHNLPSLDLMN